MSIRDESPSPAVWIRPARLADEEGRARGHDVLWLGVWEHNARARAFYARWGFVEVGEMRFLLGSDPQRDLVLERKL
jgi:ribosomal protein S18 acetylase RimI-like enzyme